MFGNHHHCMWRSFGGVALLLGLATAHAQTSGKPIRVGMLLSGSAAQWAPYESAFVAGLHERGYVEGKNLVVVRRYGELQIDRIRGSAAELGAMRLDSIVTSCPGTTKAVAGAAGGTPVIMAGVSDPVSLGIVKSLARPGVNVTGRATQSDELIPKRIELLRALLPQGARIAVLMNALEPAHQAQWPVAEVSARALGLVPVQIATRGAAGLSTALEQLSTLGVHGLLVLSDDPMTIEFRHDIVGAARSAGLPSVTGLRASTEAGALMSYAEDLTDGYRQSAAYVVKVAGGATAAELPIEQPTRFELIINLKTAKALGLTMPQSLLLRADKVIQ